MDTAWNRLCRLAGIVGIAGFTLAAFTPLARWLHARALVPPGHGATDAIVVLGASASEDALLDGPSLRRTIAGVLAARQDRAATLLLLGTRYGAANEAEIRAELARGLGVASQVIMTESRGLTTWQEAQLTAARLLPQGARRILLVTGESHMWRASAMFRRAGFEVVPLPVRELPTRPSHPEERLRLFRQVVGETVARAMHRLRGTL
jgi:uncharacterized SAM-binding protein YcdF (DUF218 family)